MAPPLLPAAGAIPCGGKDGIRRIISADAASASTTGRTKIACRPNRSPMKPPAIGPIRLPMRVTPPVVASARPRNCGEAARLIQARRASIHAPWQQPMPSSSAANAGAAATSAAPAQQPASATPAAAWSRFSPKRAQAMPIGTAMSMPPRPCRAKAAPAPANPAPSCTASSGMNGNIAATPADSSSTGRNTGSISPRRVAPARNGLRAFGAQRRTSSAFIRCRASSTAAAVWSICSSVWTALTMNAPPSASTPRLSSARLNGSP